MDAWLSSRNDVRGSEWRQIFEPEARCFCFSVAELPRLDDLIRFADLAGYDADRIFYGYAFYWSGHKASNEVERLLLLVSFFGEPASAGYRQVRTWRVRDHEVPLVVE